LRKENEMGKLASSTICQENEWSERLGGKVEKGWWRGGIGKEWDMKGKCPVYGGGMG